MLVVQDEVNERARSKHTFLKRDRDLNHEVPAPQYILPLVRR